MILHHSEQTVKVTGITINRDPHLFGFPDPNPSLLNADPDQPTNSNRSFYDKSMHLQALSNFGQINKTANFLSTLYLENLKKTQF